MGSFSYWAEVNTTDGTITGHGQTSPEAPAVPLGATTVSADQFATIEAAAADGLQCRLVGRVVRLMPVVVPSPVDLTSIRAAACVQIDQAAEACRALFLTPGSGQALEYQQTLAEAERLLAAPDGNPQARIDARDYPMLLAEQAANAAIGEHAPLEQIAADVQRQHQAWIAASSTIKETRRTAKLRVSVATSGAQISTILSALTWPAPSSTG